jgi:hypothetical protein
MLHSGSFLPYIYNIHVRDDCYKRAEEIGERNEKIKKKPRKPSQPNFSNGSYEFLPSSSSSSIAEIRFCCAFKTNVWCWQECDINLLFMCCNRIYIYTLSGRADDDDDDDK